jgi:hypothetical protein
LHANQLTGALPQQLPGNLTYLDLANSLIGAGSGIPDAWSLPDSLKVGLNSTATFGEQAPASVPAFAARLSNLG